MQFPPAMVEYINEQVQQAFIRGVHAGRSVLDLVEEPGDMFRPYTEEFRQYKDAITNAQDALGAAPDNADVLANIYSKENGFKL